MRRAAIGAALALAMTLATAAAHETTLYPSAFTIDAGQPLTFALSSMETFPTFQTGPKAERVARTVTWFGDHQAPLILSGHSETALRFVLKAPRAGVGLVGVSLAPRDIDLEPDKVAEYFTEIDPPAATRTALPAGATLHETYTKYAKAIVCAAPCNDSRAALRVLGDALEFVPVSGAEDGLSMRRFHLFARGRPAADVAVTVWSTDRHIAVRTDADGHFILPPDTHGPTMLSATVLRPPASPGARFSSDFATLTFNAP